MILDLLKEKGSTTREEIEKLIMPLLPSDLSIEKKRKKVSNMTSDLSFKEGKIKNISSSTKSPIWELSNG